MKATLIKRFDGSARLLIHSWGSVPARAVEFNTPEDAEAYCETMHIRIPITYVYGKGIGLLGNNIGVDFNTRDDTEKKERSS